MSDEEQRPFLHTRPHNSFSASPPIFLGDSQSQTQSQPEPEVVEVPPPPPKMFTRGKKKQETASTSLATSTAVAESAVAVAVEPPRLMPVLSPPISSLSTASSVPRKKKQAVRRGGKEQQSDQPPTITPAETTDKETNSELEVVAVVPKGRKKKAKEFPEVIVDELEVSEVSQDIASGPAAPKRKKRAPTANKSAKGDTAFLSRTLPASHGNDLIDLQPKSKGKGRGRVGLPPRPPSVPVDLVVLPQEEEEGLLIQQERTFSKRTTRSAKAPIDLDLSLPVSTRWSPKKPPGPGKQEEEPLKSPDSSTSTLVNVTVSPQSPTTAQGIPLVLDSDEETPPQSTSTSGRPGVKGLPSIPKMPVLNFNFSDLATASSSGSEDLFASQSTSDPTGGTTGAGDLDLDLPVEKGTSTSSRKRKVEEREEGPELKGILKMTSGPHSNLLKRVCISSDVLVHRVPVLSPSALNSDHSYLSPRPKPRIRKQGWIRTAPNNRRRQADRPFLVDPFRVSPVIMYNAPVAPASPEWDSHSGQSRATTLTNMDKSFVTSGDPGGGDDSDITPSTPVDTSTPVDNVENVENLPALPGTSGDAGAANEEDFSLVDLSGIEDPADVFVDTQSFSDDQLVTPAYPALISCTLPIDTLLHKLTTNASLDQLRSAIRDMGLLTVGDLCAISVYELRTLPINSPKVEVFLKVMKEFEEENATALEPKSDANVHSDNNEHDITLDSHAQTFGSSSLSLGQVQVPTPPSDSEQGDSEESSGSSGQSKKKTTTTDLMNNFQFLNELKDFVGTGSPAAKRLIHFLLQDKPCARQLLSTAFSKSELLTEVFATQGQGQGQDVTLSLQVLSSLITANVSKDTVLSPEVTTFLVDFLQKLESEVGAGPFSLKKWCSKVQLTFAERTVSDLDTQELAEEMRGQLEQVWTKIGHEGGGPGQKDQFLLKNLEAVYLAQLSEDGKKALLLSLAKSVCAKK